MSNANLDTLIAELRAELAAPLGWPKAAHEGLARALDALELARELLRDEVLGSDTGAQVDVDKYDDEIAKRLRGEG